MAKKTVTALDAVEDDATFKKKVLKAGRKVERLEEELNKAKEALTISRSAYKDAVNDLLGLTGALPLFDPDGAVQVDEDPDAEEPLS